MTGIAIVGTAGRLPGAADLDEYWRNLLDGKDCITRGDSDELRCHVAAELLDDARWIGASGRIDGVYDFDPESFGMAPRTALITDPQHRLLLTTVHQALEDAALIPGRDARVGVFAGVGRNRHEELVRVVSRALGEPIDELALEVGNGKDHSSTKTAFRFGFTGPAITVQTACSTGLVAVHQASQALANQECDIAIAAAAAVRVPDVHGYLYLPGGIGSTDGVCRPFSSRASGAVAGDGVVALVLMRDEDARFEALRTRAVILGSAVNNDGAKSGYASVSAAAQEAVIRDALLFAEVEPSEVGSLEAHGSGTPLGDATEWSALSAVYGTEGKTLVGSVKSNLGHLREASGLAGLVRVVGSLTHDKVPPTINVGVAADFTRERSGLELARTVQGWPRPGARRAAVSAFGLGGTNVHLVLEQARQGFEEPVPDERARPSLVVLSARTEAAVEATGRRWSDALLAGTPLTAAAAVSQLGRSRRAHRRFAVGSDPAVVAADLAEASSSAAATLPAAHQVCFVFPGVGDQYPSMAAGLRAWLPGFDAELDRLMDACGRHADRDLSAVLTAPTAGADDSAPNFSLRRLVERREAGALNEVDTVAAHAMVFSVQVALARSLQGVGIQPDAVVGHSLGELSAATVAGAFSDEDAIRLVMTRARLVDAQPAGAMLALSMSKKEAEELTGPDVWLAAVNSPRSCVVAGQRERILALADALAERGLPGRLLPVTQALHTPLMAPAAEALAELLQQVVIRQPDITIASNVTGGWVDSEITRSDYWYEHLTSTVRFDQALVTASSRCGVLLEIGPGQLRTLAAQSKRDLGDAMVVPTVRRDYQNVRDDSVLLRALGALWCAGVEPSWQALYGSRPGWRDSLPATSLEERRYDIADTVAGTVDLDARRDELLDTRAPATAPGQGGPPPATPDVSPGDADNAVLEALVHVWTEVLGVSDLRVNSDFFDLGGDSMMSVQLIRGLERRLGFHVPAIVVFEESQLGPMARCIDDWNRRESEQHA
ncbi:beta-ketoacyl synthase N-terminal-like domain-containing protein [Oerskovia sp. NPDC060338]|uniref:beta-ketoacyl synthase N-terminal-like domain-containing protein n=1 Tax=Oerskovia sp. NPDC060338 TaxID=3347100 RepID=UPI003661B63F